jgi:hypothetical protein
MVPYTVTRKLSVSLYVFRAPLHGALRNPITQKRSSIVESSGALGLEVASRSPVRQEERQRGPSNLHNPGSAEPQDWGPRNPEQVLAVGVETGPAESTVLKVAVIEDDQVRAS